MLQKLEDKLFRPVDMASLAVFRIAFGALLLWDVVKFFVFDWIALMYVRPSFHFKYYGFEWVEPWPGSLMYLHFAVTGALAFLIMIGLFYRVAIVLFLFMFSYIFLLDQTEYLNHFYFVILLNVLLVFAPANRVYAIDALIRPREGPGAHTGPAWAVWIVVAQMEIMLVFAGIVKVNPDWLALQPLLLWLSPQTHLPLIGPLLGETWVIAVGAYGVIALHILGAPLLLWRRTRLAVFVLYVLFHISNHVFFNIGIFPWLTIAGTTIFFPPDWPRRFENKAREWLRAPRAPAGVAGE
ncbi:MAG: HTTM domain-containing protein [Alphaproteobacteria bacterium]|nr:HTTM domain-containing protein [Alphaproteobacteria bacterium]